MESHVCADTSIDHCLDFNDARKEVSPFLHAPRTFFNELVDTFGVRFLRYLGITYCGLKGVSFALLTASMLPYFKLMNVEGNLFQLATVVARIPWSMKGLVGVASDCFPLGSFHKRGYLLLASLIGFIGFSTLSCVPVESWNGTSDVWRVASLFCCCNVLISTFDLLCEGKYSELMRQRHAGSEVLTMVWSCMQSGALVAALLTGLLVDWTGPRPLLAICLPLVALAAWRTCAGDLPEMPARSWKSLKLKVRSEPKLFMLAVCMAVGSLVVAIAVTICGDGGRAVVVLTVSGALIAGSFHALPPTLARGNLFMFLSSVSYVDVTGPLSYFYTGGTDCILDGPHFSYSYYLAVSNVVGSVGSILGAMIFQGMQTWTFQQAFCVTAFIQVVASVFDLMIVYRWNVAVGISDKAMYLFGDAACQSMAGMMAMMPMAMLTARLCPRGAEATVFAILAGFQNFGSSVGSILGVQLTQYFGVQASPNGPCNFHNLGTLLIITHMILPLCCLPLIYLLVPSSRMDDKEAFDIMSPAPSFRSPAASPSSRGSSTPPSPVQGPEGDPEEIVEGTLLLSGLVEGNHDYCLMEDEGEGDETRRPF